MKKVQLVINIVLVLAVVFLFINPFKKELKLGYAESSVLLSKIDKVNLLKEQLKSEFESHEETVKTMEAELNQLKAVIDYDPNNTANKEAFEKKLAEYKAFIQNAQAESKKREAELLNPLYDSITKLLDEWGNANNYDIIWGAQPTGNILYAKEGSDLTEVLITYLNASL